MTEQEAISKVAAGNSQAFSTLYDLYLNRIYRFVYYRVNHKQIAEDLTSTVFAKALRKFESFDREANFGAWIYRIARNTVIDHYRTSRATIDIEAGIEISDQTNIEYGYELGEKLAQALKYMNSLPLEQCELIQMRLWDELSYSEIAAITGKNEANLRVNFSRILKKMQKELIIMLLFIALTF